MRTLPAALGALAIGVSAAPAALAQDSSARAIAPHFTVQEAAAFSKQVEQDLAAKGARVAMVFRAGRMRDQLPEGISYTHGAFWVYREIKTADGGAVKGYAVYNLYAGDGKNWAKTESRLVQDFPLDFTRGSTVNDMAVIIPSPEMQRRILAVIDSPTYAKVHNPNYSLVANPWKRKYQNCNNFMANVIGAAIWQTDDPDRITANLKAHYKPTVVKTNAIMRTFGPIADQRLRTDDQDSTVRTATYESLAEFMRENKLLQEAYVFNYQPQASAGR